MLTRHRKSQHYKHTHHIVSQPTESQIIHSSITADADVKILLS